MADETAAPNPGLSPAPRVGGRALVPGWLDRLAAIGWRVLVAVAVVVVAIYIAVFLQIVTGAIVVALIVAATAYPLIVNLRAERGWPRARAAGAVSLLALLIVLGVIVLIAVAFLPYVAEVIRLAREGAAEFTAALASLGLPEPLDAFIERAIDRAQTSILESIQQFVLPIANLVTILIIGGFLMFYVLEDGDRAWAKATSEIDQWRADALTGRGLLALEQVGGFLRNAAVTAVVDATTDWFFLMLLGVPFAGPLAVVVFFGAFVPVVGGLVTTSLLFLVTLASSGFPAALALLALIAITNLIQNRFIAPRVSGPGLSVHPALAVVAVIAAGWLFGFVGVFGALPFIAIVSAFAPAVVAALGTAQMNEDDGASLVPIWLDRIAQWGWRLLVVLAVGWLMIQVFVVPLFTAPVVLALLLGAALGPAVDGLARRGLSRTWATLAVCFASLAVVVLVLAITIVAIGQSLPEIVAQAGIGADNLGLGTTPRALVDSVGEFLVGNFLPVLANVLGIVVALLIAAVLTFFFLRDGASWWGQIVARIPAAQRDRVDGMGTLSADILRGTTIGTAISSFAGAVLQWFTMFILGLPLAFPIGVLTFFFGFIPYFGSLVTTTLGFLVAVAVGEPIDIVLMFIFTIVFNIVQGNVVAPLVFGKTFSVHPSVVLLAAPAGGAIGGILGMVMITPLLSIIGKTWRTVIHLFDPSDAETPTVTSPAAASHAHPAMAQRPSPATEGAEP